jgi:hypothetical protein
MQTIYVVGRCLTCWGMTVAPASVERHLPAAFAAVCAPCGRDREFAVTGQVYSSLSQATLRKLKSAQERKARPEWEQIPLVEALIPKDGPSPAPGETHAYQKGVAPIANKKGSGSTRPRQSPSE